MVSSFKFDGGTLQPRLKAADKKAQGYLALVTQYYASQAEAQARLNAPWTDRTGNARNGLRGVPEINHPNYAIVLAHSVNYGIWLEVRWGGRYAIIMPTLRSIGPQYIDAAAKVLGAI